MILRALLTLGLIGHCATAQAPADPEPNPKPLFEWSALPPLPDPVGVAGPFVGVHDGALIVAGGANFEPPVWEHDKVWHDAIYVLDRDDSGELAWFDAGSLPRPLAYGASASTSFGVVCAGGNDSTETYGDAFLLRWNRERRTVELEELPPLSTPVAQCAAAAIGDRVFVVGGLTTHALSSATGLGWVIDVAGSRDWRLVGAPSPRAFAVAAVQHDGHEERLFVMSGRRLSASGEAEFLTDVWAYTPGRSDETFEWTRRADLPRCVMAGTAAPVGSSHVAVLSGADGSLYGKADELRDEHPGFPRETLLYHTITDTWTSTGEAPASPVTTWAVPFDDALVIPSGEIRPRVRSPEVWRVQWNSRERSFGLLNVIVLVAYLTAMVGIGAHFARNSGSDDFFRGGQRIPWWAAGLSIFATTLSSITFMAIPAKAYATDWVYSLGNVTILFVAPIVIYLFLPFYRQIDATSVYEYLELRFNVAVRMVGSALFLLFQVARMAIVLLLPALALSTITPLSVDECILAMGLLSILYSTMGGIRAVIWTDVVQAIVLLGGAVFCLVLIAVRNGDGDGVIEVGVANDKLRIANWTWDHTTTALWVVVIGNIFSNIVTYTSDQAVVQRYMTTPTQKKAARAIWINGVMALVATAVFYSLGSSLYAFYKAHPERLDPSFATDAILPLFISRELPAGIAGLVVAGIFAAAQSTVSTSMNSTSTVVVTDFYRRFAPHAAEKKVLSLARLFTVVLGGIGTAFALVLAHSEVQSLLDEFMRYLGLTTGALGGLFVLGIVSRRAHAGGALIGAVSGALALYWVQSATEVHFFLFAGIGMLTCMAVGYLASLVLPAKERDLSGLTLATMRRTSS